MISFRLVPERVVRLLIAVAFGFALAHLAVQIYHYTHPDMGRIAKTIVRLFNDEEEESLPTYYSTLLPLIASVLAFYISSLRKAAGDLLAGRWMALGAVMLYISVDEASEIHEPAEQVPAMLGIHNPIFSHWTTIFVPFALVVLIMMLPVMRRLPKQIATGIVVAGVVYVFAAAGLDKIGAQFEGATRSMFEMVEELGEQIGLSILIYTLLTYITSLTRPGLPPEMSQSEVEQKETAPMTLL